MHKFGYKIIGNALPDSVLTDTGLMSVKCPWDYLGNARYVCAALDVPAGVINTKGKVLFRNDAAKEIKLAEFVLSGPQGPFMSDGREICFRCNTPIVKGEERVISTIDGSGNARKVAVHAAFDDLGFCL